MAQRRRRAREVLDQATAYAWVLLFFHPRDEGRITRSFLAGCIELPLTRKQPLEYPQVVQQSTP